MKRTPVTLCLAFCATYMASAQLPHLQKSKFPSGGPLPKVIDIWPAACPSIDFLAPDIYTDEFDFMLKQFSLDGNPLVIPECTFEISNELYAIGEYYVPDFCPFGIDVNDEGFSMAATDSKTLDYLYGGSATQNYGTGNGFRKSRKSDGALILLSGEDTFTIIGKDILISYSMKENVKGGYVAKEYVEAVTFKNNQWIPGRRIDGDESYFVNFGEVKAIKEALFKAPYENRILF